MNCFSARFAVAVVILAILGCAADNDKLPELHQDMRDAYQEARTLYGYVWSNDLFYDPRSEKTIAKSLERMSGNFHKAELDAPLEAFEPGFRVALMTQKNLLTDVSARFKEGKKEYAMWRLRGMAANCIACHSRYQAPVNFVGDLPSAPNQLPETLMSQGEFLFATRQFDKAGELLYQMAQQFSASQAGWQYQFQALKLWLVIEVRTKNNPGKSAEMLNQYLAAADVPPVYRSSILSWVQDLRALDKRPPSDRPSLTEAKRLLEPLSMESTIDDEERHLVTTLRATSLLHELLQGSPSVDEKRQGTYLLALAYFHIPLSLFEPFVDQYLEMTVREYSHTPEALSAVKYYEHRLRSGLGISGSELAPDQLKVLLELKKLAAPESEPVMQSMG